MFGLFADPAPIPAHYWADVAPIAPHARPRPPRNVEGLKVTVLGEFTHDFRMREQYRMHTRPELYPHWQVDLHDTLLDTELDRTGVVAIDCDACRITSLTRSFTDPCPRCGS